MKRYANKLKDNGHLLDTTPYLDNVVQYDRQNMMIDPNGQRIYDSMNIGPLVAVSVPGKLITNIFCTNTQRLRQRRAQGGHGRP